jgi:hypothetical protein
MVKSPQPPLSIEPFPGGRLVRYLKDGYPHILIQISGDQLAAALRGSPATQQVHLPVRRCPMPRTRESPLVARPPVHKTALTLTAAESFARWSIRVPVAYEQRLQPEPTL